MKNVYIIGEIGQNHNGSVDIAKLIIDYASKTVSDGTHSKFKGMDAIKLTKRDLQFELSHSEMQRPYTSPNSFGKTYGEHRKFLELTNEQHFELYKYTKNLNLDFIITLCSPSCLSILKFFIPDYIKIASRDVTNHILLEALAKTNIPLIMSLGMVGKSELDSALEIITAYHTNITLLHCVSQYPAEPENINLNSILYLRDHYPQFRIGYSDHSIGLSIPLAAVAMGAEVIEKHITLDRKMKGTDQIGSLGIDGIFRLVRNIRTLELAKGNYNFKISEGILKNKQKLERSIASKRTIIKGETIKIDDIHLLSPGDGYKWSDRDMVIGKTASCDIPQNEIIYNTLLSQ